MATTNCHDCKRQFSFMGSKYTCFTCKATLCGDCVLYCLPDGHHGNNGLQSYCWADFQKASNIDFSQPFTVSGPEDAPIILFVHGASGSREMWYPQVEHLSKKFRCITIDLPGHGSRVKESLTLASAEKAILDAIAAVVKNPHQKVLYVGNSLGAYLGFDIVGRNVDKFWGAVICGAGQNTGAGAGIAAKLGLEMFKMMMGLPKHMIISSLLNQAAANTNLDSVVIERSILRPGIFFERGLEHISILENFHAKQLMHFKGPVLFVNGEKDHHDSQEKWRDMVSQGQLVELKDADHFFSHDKRFVEKFNHMIESFAERAMYRSPSINHTASSC